MPILTYFGNHNSIYNQNLISTKIFIYVFDQNKDDEKSLQKAWKLGDIESFRMPHLKWQIPTVWELTQSISVFSNKYIIQEVKTFTEEMFLE